jgi:16S rRNA (guanine527-N7)-methyltransferase
MEVGDADWRERVRAGAAALSVSLSPEALERMARHGRMLLQWNRKVNLTRIVDPDEVAVKHFVDALAPVPFLPPEARIVDIGAGGGFPGIPLAAVRSGLRVTLVDSVRKKASFMDHVIRILELANAEARHVRAESLAEEAAGVFDLAICRALADLPEILRLAAPLLRPGGEILALKGRISPEETEFLSTREAEGFRVSVHRYALPFLGDPRALVSVKLPGDAAPANA